MAVPDFQSLMLPVLEVLASGGDLPSATIREKVASALDLPEADQTELLPSGRQTRFANRVAWATIYLMQAGLASSVKRGVYRISDRGRDVRAKRPDRIDIRYLSQFAEFVRWKSRGNSTGTAAGEEPASTPVPEITPEEQLDAGYLALREKVEEELLAKIMAATPKFFEELVVELLVSMGYGGSRVDAGKALGRSGDGGLDGMIKEDKLGLDAIYIQAKRWDGSRTVGRPDVQAFAGSLEGERARKGVFITTSSFSKDASDYVKRIEKKIVLIDGATLTQLMFDHGVGVRLKETYEVKEVDEDYFGLE